MSIPTPTYYAHLVADRARKHHNELAGYESGGGSISGNSGGSVKLTEAEKRKIQSILEEGVKKPMYFVWRLKIGGGGRKLMAVKCLCIFTIGAIVIDNNWLFEDFIKFELYNDSFFHFFLFQEGISYTFWIFFYFR